jgi:hypothetical protein
VSRHLADLVFLIAVSGDIPSCALHESHH